MTDTGESKQELLKKALQHLESGLDFLDDARAPGDIGAHVDLAGHKLKSAIAAAAEASERYEA
ncbi:MAG TPA: hypothetical protein VJ775_02885 [Sphingomicrobium sp.]|nr:hypothetical protein [Sphingomicrobium sp.]